MIPNRVHGGRVPASDTHCELIAVDLKFIRPGIEKDEAEHRRELCAAGVLLYWRGFAVATDGNLSLWLDNERVLTSPTGLNKGILDPEELVVTDVDGRQVGGQLSPSSELAMHLAVNRRRSDVRAVCHAQSPVATGYAAAGIGLDKALLTESILDLACVPVAPYATPGTKDLPESLDPLVEQFNAILLANHGVVTFGPDLLTAFS